MKRFFLFVACVASCLCMNAQKLLDVYSVYDVDFDKRISVKDIIQVVNRYSICQVVDTEQLYQVLLSMDQKLSALSEVEEIVQSLEKIEALLDTVPLEECLNGHDFVDYGTKDAKGNPIYWATCNIGAVTPGETGNLYAWGEVIPKSEYTIDNYKWYDDEIYTKYHYGEKPTYWPLLWPEDDVAQTEWGGAWRMPTEEELKSAHLPVGSYWGNTLVNTTDKYNRDSPKAVLLQVYQDKPKSITSMERYKGYPVRAVCAPAEYRRKK